jgi:hypothetical protein
MKRRVDKNSLDPGKHGETNMIIWVFPATKELIHRCVRRHLGSSLSSWCERALYKAACKELKAAGEEIPLFTRDVVVKPTLGKGKLVGKSK